MVQKSGVHQFEVGSLFDYLQGFSTIPGGCLGFLPSCFNISLFGDLSRNSQRNAGGFRSHYLSFTKTMFFVKAYLEPETAISRCWFQISFMEMVKHQFFHVLILTHPIRGTANNHFLMDVW